MGLLDDVMNDGLPGGGLAKPIVIAVGALLLRNMFSKGDSTPAPAPVPGHATAPDGGLFGGLSDLMQKFQQAGQQPTLDSWVGHGQNQSIAPAQLGTTLGQQTISSLAQKAGISEQELLAALASALPGVIDKLTPHGRMPTQGELSRG